jgi:hypothetical protein
LDDSSGVHYAVSGRVLTITGDGEFDGERLSDYLVSICDPEVFGDVCRRAVIEEIIIGEGITAISGDQWGQQTAVRSISLPSSLAFIENEVFTNMESLTQVSVGANFDADWPGRWWPASLRSITSPTDSSGLLLSKDGKAIRIYPPGRPDKRYTMPVTVTLIESHAFEHAVNLEEVIFSNVVVMHSAAFMDCANLRVTELPDSLEHLYGSAFAGCPKIVSLALGSSLYWLGESCFPESLASITGAPGNPLFSASSDVLFSKDGTELLLYPRSRTGASYVPPVSAVSVGDGAMAHALNLVSISLPSVLAIGRRAFEGCDRLVEVSVPSAVSIEEEAFYYCTSLESILFGPDIRTIGDYGFSACAQLNLDAIPFGLTEISDWVTIIGAHHLDTARPLAQFGFQTH